MLPGIVASAVLFLPLLGIFGIFHLQFNRIYVGKPLVVYSAWILAVPEEEPLSLLLSSSLLFVRGIHTFLRQLGGRSIFDNTFYFSNDEEPVV